MDRGVIGIPRQTLGLVESLPGLLDCAAAWSPSASAVSGLASGMFNTTYQVGSALGLAALTALAITYGAERVGHPHALTHGFHAAFLGGAGIALAGSLAALTLIRAARPA